MIRLLLCFVSMVTWSAQGAIPPASAQVLSLYSLKNADPQVLDSIAKFFEITRPQGAAFEVIVPQSQVNIFRALAPRAELLEEDMSATIREKLRSYALKNSVMAQGYHDFSQVQAWMNSLVTTYAQNTQLIQYGSSQGGKPLLALRVSENLQQETKPAVMITAATHGDELITTEVLMELVNQFLGSYGKDARFTRMLEKNDIYFIPVVNPDGFVQTDRYDNGRDPNRSYPYPGHEAQRPTASIAGVMSFFKAHNIIGSIDFHAYGELIMYPWAYTHSPIDSTSAAKFHDLTGRMASTNRYVYGPIADVIYVAPGSSADYYFWQKKSVSLGIEMGESKIPDPSEFPSYVQSQAESTWRFLESFE